MDKLMIQALTTFNDAMSELIDACADLSEVEAGGAIDIGHGVSLHMKGGGASTKRGGGSWEGAMGYEVVLSRFATARAAYMAIPDRE